MRKKKKKQNKFLKVLLLLAACCSLLFLFILVYFLRLVLSPPELYQAEMLTPAHVYHQSRAVNRLTQLLIQSKPGKVCVLTLSQEEVNALIAAISNSDSLGDFLLSAGKIGEEPKKRPYKIVFKDNRFDIKFSLPTDYNTPFGTHINLSASGKPELTKEGISVDLQSAAAGNLELPPELIEKILRIILKDYEQDVTFKRIHDVIVKAYITPENDLVIYFYPYRIRNCFTEGF